jgi:acetylornithine deacetylase/succinyl-diaminopimelate desuccinylase-like protein
MQALRDTFAAEPLFKREGGSVPVVALMQQKLGVDSVMMGFSLPDDGIHGPNERHHLPTFYRGIEAYVRLLYGLGAPVRHDHS